MNKVCDRMVQFEVDTELKPNRFDSVADKTAWTRAIGQFEALATAIRSRGDANG